MKWLGMYTRKADNLICLPLSNLRAIRGVVSMPLAPSVVSRFWKYVDKNGPVHPKYGKCWVWTGVLRQGYGRIRIGTSLKTAHRISWNIHHGKIPSGVCVCHRCDNTGCINPNHLFLGTHQDNVIDMIHKGRERYACGKDHRSYTHPESIPRGETHGMTKLTEKEVLEIRDLCTTGGLPSRKVGIMYKVSKSTVNRIVSKKTWGHI